MQPLVAPQSPVFENALGHPSCQQHNVDINFGTAGMSYCVLPPLLWWDLLDSSAFSASFPPLHLNYLLDELHHCPIGFLFDHASLAS